MIVVEGPHPMTVEERYRIYQQLASLGHRQIMILDKGMKLKRIDEFPEFENGEGI